MISLKEIRIKKKALTQDQRDVHLYKIKAKLCFPEREKSNGSSRNDKEKSQETALYIYTEYTKEEYLTIRMEIVILLVTGKLPILSFIARDMQIHS